MYKIESDNLGDFKRVTLINDETGEHVSIIPSYGGNVVSIVLNNEEELFNIIEADLSKEKLLENCCHRNAKLFPFPNRIRDGVYNVSGNTYKLPINQKVENNAIHGFVFDKQFQIVSTHNNNENASVMLEYDYDGSIDGFPFLFCLQIEYCLSKKGLDIKTIVKNTGNKPLPMGDGWHPYFKLNEPVDELYLEIPSNKKIIVDNRMIPTGEVKVDNSFCSISRIGEETFDDGFIIENQKLATTRLKSKSRNVTINVWQDSGENAYNFLQIYIPPHRNSIAIEPMSCKTDAFNNGDGLLLLEPNDMFSASYGVYLS